MKLFILILWAFILIISVATLITSLITQDINIIRISIPAIILSALTILAIIDEETIPSFTAEAFKWM